MNLDKTPRGQPTLARAEAERLLRSIVAKAQHINAHPEEFPFAVVSISVFGSFLTDKPVLGDLDVAIEVTRVRQPEYGGHYARDVHWAEKTGRALRLRRPKVISVHWLDGDQEHGCAARGGLQEQMTDQ